MEGSQNGTPNSQSVPTNAQQESRFEDEINPVDYLRVLWKHKNFLLPGSVLAALFVGLILFFWPRDYKVTYICDIGLAEKAYKDLLDRFYSAENLDKITTGLKENGLDKYAQKIAKANTDRVLKDLQKIQRVGGSLLAMTITVSPKMYAEDNMCKYSFY